jgi:hypothetical protein
MNTFILDNTIEQCAQAHCEQHVGKMILERAQLLYPAPNEKGLAAWTQQDMPTGMVPTLTHPVPAT